MWCIALKVENFEFLTNFHFNTHILLKKFDDLSISNFNLKKISKTMFNKMDKYNREDNERRYYTLEFKAIIILYYEA